MKSTVVAVLSVFLVAAASTTAQRISGPDDCVNTCYQISVAVTQCPDLSDTGVISCICPNTTGVTQLNSCHSCISTLQGISDFEKNSIDTLFQACSQGGSTAGLSSAQARASSLLSTSSVATTSRLSSSGTVGGSRTTSATSASSAASSAAAQKTGAATQQIAAVSTLALAGLAGLVTFVM